MPDNGRRRQQRYPWVALLLALSFFSPQSAQAGIFKCLAANGEITFAQTPCPKEKKEVKAEEVATDLVTSADETTPKRSHIPDDSEKVVEQTLLAFASTAPQPSELQPEQEKLAENPALQAQKRQADARDEEHRMQCKDNVKSQINSINSQMRSSSYSSALADSLKKKRQALEARLDDC